MLASPGAAGRAGLIADAVLGSLASGGELRPQQECGSMLGTELAE